MRPQGYERRGGTSTGGPGQETAPPAMFIRSRLALNPGDATGGLRLGCPIRAAIGPARGMMLMWEQSSHTHTRASPSKLPYFFRSFIVG